jgi:hypothetical protein
MKFLSTFLSVFLAISSVLWGQDEIRKELDAALAFKRKGQEIPLDVREKCFESFKKYSDGLFEKYKVELNTQYPEPDRTEYYVNCARIGLVRPTTHGGWIKRSSLRIETMSNLIKQTQDAVAKNDETYDPLRIFAYFLPATQTGKADIAIQAYELLLKRDPFLAKQALLCSTNHWHGAIWIETYYKSRKIKAQAQEARKLYMEALFPNGKKEVKLDQLKSAPTAGVIILDKTDDTVPAILTGDVIVAINGWHVLDIQQYGHFWGLDSKNPKIKLIIWRHKQFVEVEVNAPSRMLGANMTTYDPP